MMMRNPRNAICGLLTVGAMLLPTIASAQQCSDGRTLFVGDAIEGRDTKTIAYFPEGRNLGAPLTFEGWQGKTMLWRVTGTFTCSNGVVICGVSIPLSDGETIEADETAIREGDETRYMVLSTLLQSSYLRQRGEPATTINAEWKGAQPGADPDDPSILLPSVWKAEGCAR